MKPRIPEVLLPTVRAALKGGARHAVFKCRLSRGRTVYGVEIDEDGHICRVGDRPVFAPSDLAFTMNRIEAVEPYFNTTS